jgi:hypothetical protein
VVGLGAASGQTTLVAAWYLGLTAFVLAAAYLGRGLPRRHGGVIVSAYLSFGGVVVATAYSSPLGVLLSTAPLALAWPALASAHWRSSGGRIGPRSETAASGARTGSELGEANGLISPPLAEPNGWSPTDGNQPTLHRPVRGQSQSLLAGWSITRVWRLALAISSLIAATDAILGPRVILIGLLIAGPCCALLTGRWARTAAAGAWAIGLAVLLGLPDGIWGTSTHLVFLAAVVIVAVISTSSAAVIERRH